MPTATKKDLIKIVSNEIGLTQLRTHEIVQKTLEALVDALMSDHRVELRGFGVFQVEKRAARKARNPRTGGVVDVPAKRIVTFKPGKEVRDRCHDAPTKDTSVGA